MACDYCGADEPLGCFQEEDGAWVNICQGCAVGYGFLPEPE